MSNDYYTATEISRLSLARSSAENLDRAAVEAAFDLLPERLKLLQNRVAFYTAGGTANALTVTMSPTLLSYEAGLRITVLLSATNTASATMNVDGLGARNIKLITGSLVEAGELTSGTIVDLIYNGTDFYISSPTQRLVSGIANINDPITFGSTVDVTQGPLSVTGNTASGVYVQVQAQDGSEAGIQLYDNDNTVMRDALMNTGADALRLGDAGWANQQMLGDWSISGTFTVSTVAISGGTINGTVIGGSSAAAGTFTTINASGTITGNVTGNLTGVASSATTLTGLTASIANLNLLAGKSLTGSDTAIVTGTAGASGRIAKWNADGDLVDAGPAITSLASMGTAANKGVYTTGVGAFAEFDLTAAGRALLDDADASAQRTTLGLGTAALLSDSEETDLATDPDAVARRDLVKAYVDASVVTQAVIAAGSFDGTGTPAWNYRNGFGATITDNGTGDYTVAFDSAEADANYVVQITAESPGAGVSNRQFVFHHTLTTSGFSVRVTDINGSAVDRDGIHVTVTRLTWS